MKNDKVFAKNFRAKRKTKQLTQAQLAKKINVSQSYLSEIETGKVSPSWAFIRKAASFFGGSVDELFQLHTGSVRDVSSCCFRCECGRLYPQD